MVDMGQADARKTVVSSDTDGVFARHRERVAELSRTYSVIVGNVGTVYDGPDRQIAFASYDSWVRTSDEGRGSGAGEPVTLMRDGEPLFEHMGYLSAR